jgi:hypothetical protein
MSPVPASFHDIRSNCHRKPITCWADDAIHPHRNRNRNGDPMGRFHGRHRKVEWILKEIDDLSFGGDINCLHS